MQTRQIVQPKGGKLQRGSSRRANVAKGLSKTIVNDDILGLNLNMTPRSNNTVTRRNTTINLIGNKNSAYKSNEAELLVQETTARKNEVDVIEEES